MQPLGPSVKWKQLASLAQGWRVSVAELLQIGSAVGVAVGPGLVDPPREGGSDVHVAVYDLEQLVTHFLTFPQSPSPHSS